MVFTTARKIVASAAAVVAMSGAGVALTASTADAASVATWNKVAQCESSGRWHLNTGNGYYGGLQISASTWHQYGGKGLPHQHSKAEQIRIANRILRGQGWRAWPNCHP